MPLNKLDPATVSVERRGASNPIYVMCQSGGRASKDCERLQEAGLADVYCVEGGMTAWEKIHLPVERGATKAISLERQVRISAGSIVLLGVALAWTIQSAFLAIAALFGAGLIFAGITDYCGMAFVLSKMTWNRQSPR
jgi:3-mercaptopyruvate sulfurtransferase SseA